MLVQSMRRGAKLLAARSRIHQGSRTAPGRSAAPKRFVPPIPGHDHRRPRHTISISEGQTLFPLSCCGLDALFAFVVHAASPGAAFRRRGGMSNRQNKMSSFDHDHSPKLLNEGPLIDTRHVNHQPDRRQSHFSVKWNVGTHSMRKMKAQSLAELVRMADAG